MLALADVDPDKANQIALKLCKTGDGDRQRTGIRALIHSKYPDLQSPALDVLHSKDHTARFYGALVLKHFDRPEVRHEAIKAICNETDKNVTDMLLSKLITAHKPILAMSPSDDQEFVDAMTQLAVADRKPVLDTMWIAFDHQLEVNGQLRPMSILRLPKTKALLENWAAHGSEEIKWSVYRIDPIIGSED